MLREEEMQWEHGYSKPRYHMRWNHSLGEAATSATSPTDSAGSMHAEYMNLPDADGDQLSQFRSESCLVLLHYAQHGSTEISGQLCVALALAAALTRQARDMWLALLLLLGMESLYSSFLQQVSMSVAHVLALMSGFQTMSVKTHSSTCQILDRAETDQSFLCGQHKHEDGTQLCCLLKSALPTAADDTVCRSPKHSRPDVSITHSSMNHYWLVTIKCKDRTKLLFDTVCTLADMDYDVFHATIDSVKGDALQEYYIKPRLGKPGKKPLRLLLLMLCNSTLPCEHPHSRPVA